MVPAAPAPDGSERDRAVFAGMAGVTHLTIESAERSADRSVVVTLTSRNAELSVSDTGIDA